MEQQIEDFLANLLSMGMKQEQAVEKGYEYVLALLSEQQRRGESVTAAMMASAAQLVKNALPGAYRNYDLRNRIR